MEKALIDTNLSKSILRWETRGNQFLSIDAQHEKLTNLKNDFSSILKFFQTKMMKIAISKFLQRTKFHVS